MIKDVTSIFPFQQISVPASSTALTVPTRDTLGVAGTPTVAMIQCENVAVRWRDDGVAPTASVGMRLEPSSILMYDGDLTRIRFIQVGGGSALNVSYYK